MYFFIYIVYFSLYFCVFSHKIGIIYNNYFKNQNNKLKFWVQSDFHHNNTYKSVRWCIVKHKLIPYIFENRKLNSLQRGLKYITFDYIIEYGQLHQKHPSWTKLIENDSASCCQQCLLLFSYKKTHVISNLKEVV